MLFDSSHPYNDLLKPYKYKVFYGGRSAAKSWTIAEALVRIAQCAKVRVLCTRELQTSIADSSHKLLCDTISRLGMDADFTITQSNIYSKTGSEFLFKGIKHNYVEIKSLEGIDITWAEECQNTSEEAWRIVLPTSIRKPGSEVWISFNTGAETDSTYKRWVKNTPDNAVVHLVNYDQNKYCTEESLGIMEHDKKTLDSAVYDNIWLGVPLKLSEAIIFRNKYTVQEFEAPDRMDFLHGLDFGFSSDPFAMVRCYINNQILYIDYECGGYGIELDEYGPHIRSIPTGQTWKIYADSANPGNISLLKRQGFNVDPVKKYSGSIEDGINHIKAYDQIIVHPRCTQLIKELGLYSYKRDRVSGDIQPVPLDKDNHYIDALRYSLNKYILKKGTTNATWEVLGG